MIKRKLELNRIHSQARIGWTAQFTAAVWGRLGVAGAQRFVTRRGQLLERIVRWGGGLCGLRGEYSVVNLFLAPRYMGINALLQEQHPAQIIELAAGLSGRGYEWTRQHAGVYIEVDQQGVIATKARSIGAPGHSSPNLLGKHLLITADLRQAGWAAQIALLLDPGLPTLIICEGLTGYLDEKAMNALLSSLWDLAARLDKATIWLDFYLRLSSGQHGRVAWAMAPAQLMWRSLRAPMRMFWRDATHIRQMLATNGFETQRLWSSRELACLAGIKPPPLNLFYLAEIRPVLS